MRTVAENVVTGTQTDRQTDRQTDTQNDYSNPRCACAPRVKKCKPLAHITPPRAYSYYNGLAGWKRTSTVIYTRKNAPVIAYKSARVRISRKIHAHTYNCSLADKYGGLLRGKQKALLSLQRRIFRENRTNFLIFIHREVRMARMNVGEVRC